MDVEFTVDIFGDDDFAGFITDPPMDREHFLEGHELRLGDVELVFQSCDRLVDGGAVAEQVCRNLPTGDRLIDRRRCRILILRVTGQVEHTNSQPHLVLSVGDDARSHIDIESDRAVFRFPPESRFAGWGGARVFRTARYNEYLRIERIPELHGAEIDLRPVVGFELERGASHSGAGNAQCQTGDQAGQGVSGFLHKLEGSGSAIRTARK